MSEFSSLREMSSGLAQGAYSSVELAQAHLERIQHANATLNCFISVNAEFALAAAAQADQQRAQGDRRATLGLPFAHKDIFCTRDILTTAGSNMLSNFVAPYDATVVSNMTAAGMISVGKTNMDEFAMGSANTTSFFGNVINPLKSKNSDKDLVPGGSSGGSASSVAAGLCLAATGSDTGGSIRQPASFCGLAESSTVKAIGPAV